MFEKIRKRDGRIVEFDLSKITAAFASAGRATGQFGQREAENLTVYAVETGCRREEILSLQWQDVEGFKKTVTIFGKKTGQRRAIPLTERAFEILKGRERVRTKVRPITGDLVFTHPVGRKINIHTLRSAFEDALKKADIQGFSFHDFRHTFATRLAQTGVDPYTIQKLMGHTSFTTTQRYAHHFVEILRGGSNIRKCPGKSGRKKLAQ